MKTSRLLTLGACAAFAFTGLTSQTVFAAEKEHAEHAEKMVIPATVDGIMEAIHKAHGELGEVVKAKKLADVHHKAFAVRDLANALPAKVAADKKARVEGSVKNIAKLADDLDKAGDDNNQAATEANLKKLDGVLTALAQQVK